MHRSRVSAPICRTASPPGVIRSGVSKAPVETTSPSVCRRMRGTNRYSPGWLRSSRNSTRATSHAARRNAGTRTVMPSAWIPAAGTNVSPTGDAASAAGRAPRFAFVSFGPRSSAGKRACTSATDPRPRARQTSRCTITRPSSPTGARL